MSQRGDEAPELVLRWTDRPTGIWGALVIERLIGGAAAGGLRISPDLDEAALSALARNMSYKQAVAGIRVGGAKSGLRMDPADPRRREVLGRFLRALRPMIAEHYSVGPDVNTTMAELDALAREVGIGSLKFAVAKSRGIDAATWERRYGLFEERVGDATVNELRAATGTAAAVARLAAELKIEGPFSISIQGAGNMGGATARVLAEEGARVVAWADDEKCLLDESGLDVAALLRGRSLGRLPRRNGARDRESVLEAPCDVLVLAAISRAIPREGVGRLRARGVVAAANLALEREVERALFEAGIWVVPDVIASVGGSLAVEALYAGDPRSGRDVLEHVRRRADGLTGKMIEEARACACEPRVVVDRWWQLASEASA
jgi:glutamate dehydrogenase (NAD(P)+)